MSHLERLRDEIQHRKGEAIGILQLRLTDDQIKEMCARFIQAPPDAELIQDLKDEGFPLEIFFAVAASCCLMYLEKNIPPNPEYQVSAEDAADLILTGFNAMITLIEAGWKPAEQLALTRLKQKQNQPKTRSRVNVERDDIEEELSLYTKRYKHPPASLDIFMSVLELNGFTIDYAKKTVDKCDGIWRQPRAFRTIDDWLRNYRK
jgi:hypothetical protein